MQEINLYDLIKYYAKNWVFIATLTVLGLIGGIIYNNYIQTPLYKSDATLLVVDSADSAPQDTTTINNYVELFKSRRVLEPVITTVHIPITYDELVKSVDTTNEKDTELIKVSISSEDPSTSKALVSGAVTSFMKQIAKLYAVDNIQVVDKASNATPPFNVHKGMQITLGTLGGLVSAFIALFFVYDYNFGKKQVNKNVNKKINKNRIIYNLGIMLTGRVGFFALIPKKTTTSKVFKYQESIKKYLKNITRKASTNSKSTKTTTAKKPSRKRTASKTGAKTSTTKKRTA